MANGRKTPVSRTPSSRPSSSTFSTTSGSRPGSTRLLSRPNTPSANDKGQRQLGDRPNTGSSRGRTGYGLESRPATGASTRNDRRRSSAGARSWAVTQHVLKVGMSTQLQYQKVKQVLTKPTNQRMMPEISALEIWFRKKTKLFEKLKRETLHDVIKHCEFRTVDKDTVIIEQGFKGNEKIFYIILRGKVAVIVKDEVLDEDDQLQTNENISEFMDHDKMETDRTKLGETVNHIGDGGTFGELALINDDNNRTASIVADDETDLICISRDLYERSVGKLIREDFQSKLNFIEKNKLLREWPMKWKRQLATCLHRKKLSYDEVLHKQGDSSDHIYFITKGELKLIADPAMHEAQFPEFMNKMSSDFVEDVYKSHGTHFGLQHYYSSRSRQVTRLKHANDKFTFDGVVQSAALQQNKLILSPSERRRITVSRSKMHRKYNICYLEAGQYVGDVEFLVGLDQYHGTAISTSQETVVIELHHVQFNRYFIKKNPETVDEMTQKLGLQMPRRMVQEHIQKNVPLLQCIMAKLDDLNGTCFVKRKPRQDDDALSTAETEFSSNMGQKNRSKSGTGSRTRPVTSKQKNDGASKYINFGFNLPEIPEQVLAKYLNTQVNQVLQMEKENEKEEEAEIQNPEETIVALPEGGVHTMAQVERPKKVEKKRREMQPRDGIFFKILQVSNPNIDKNALAIDEEEFNYLCQIKRRITKELHKFYPFASLESFLTHGDDEPRSGGGRLCKRMVQSAGASPESQSTNQKNKKYTMPKKAVLKTNVSRSAGVQGRKNVGFAV